MPKMASTHPGDIGTMLSKRSDIALYQAKELGKNPTEAGV